MEIYVLQDGARRGPFLPFKLRELMEDRSILPSDPGWIEGMEAWAPLESIEALSSWMPRPPQEPPPLPSPSQGAQPPASPSTSATSAEGSARRQRAWLRWFARTVDEMLWFALLWSIGLAAGWLDLWDFVFRHPVLLFGPPALWIPLEAFLLSRWSTTPGKWLLGMRVADADGQPLSFPAALKRSVLVLCTGNGFGLPFMLLLPMLQAAMSWTLYRRTGSTLWDRASASQVEHAPPPSLGLIAIGATLLSWVALGTWISLALPLPPDFPPEQRQPIQEIRQQFQNSWNQLHSSPPAPKKSPAAA